MAADRWDLDYHTENDCLYTDLSCRLSEYIYLFTSLRHRDRSLKAPYIYLYIQ